MIAPDESSDGASGERLRLPLGLALAALLLLVIFQTFDLVRDHFALSDVRTSQETTIQQATKLRNQLETLAGKTAQLANDGDTAAREVVDVMQRQGVTLTPPKH